jgi:hypothetical protein
MASSSNSEWLTSPHNPWRFCICNKRVIVRECDDAWEGLFENRENYRRRYWGCPNTSLGRFEYKVWIDHPYNPRTLEIITDLLAAVCDTEGKLGGLQDLVDTMREMTTLHHREILDLEAANIALQEENAALSAELKSLIDEKNEFTSSSNR